MLDKKTAVVLAYLNGECNGGAYKVIEKEDILSSLPKKYAFDEEMLVETLDYLCERSYISIKHKDENMICVGVLPKGRLFAEEKAKEIKERKEDSKKFLTTTFFGSLIGGLLGGILGAILIAFIV